jgi:hypothetical protein
MRQAGSINQGPLDLPQLVQALQRVHPGIKGVQMTRALAAALPLLNMVGRQQLQQMGMDLRRQMILDREASTRMTEQDRAQNRDLRAAGQAKTATATRDKVNEARDNRNIARQTLNQLRMRLTALETFTGTKTPEMEQEMKDLREQIKDAVKEAETANKEYDSTLKGSRGGGNEQGDAAVPEGGGTEANPVKVKTPQDAEKLKPGTVYVTPDGQVMVR